MTRFVFAILSLLVVQMASADKPSSKSEVGETKKSPGGFIELEIESDDDTPAPEREPAGDVDTDDSGATTMTIMTTVARVSVSPDRKPADRWDRARSTAWLWQGLRLSWVFGGKSNSIYPPDCKDRAASWDARG